MTSPFEKQSEPTTLNHIEYILGMRKRVQPAAYARVRQMKRRVGHGETLTGAELAYLRALRSVLEANPKALNTEARR